MSAQENKNMKMKLFPLTLRIRLYVTPRINSTCVMEKRGTVEINNSPQAGIEPGASRFKIQNSTE